MQVRASILFILLFLSLSQAMAQTNPKIEEVKNETLVALLNNIRLIGETRTKEISIRVYTADNSSGSAGFANGEITQNLLVAVTEYDEAPDQNLFEIGPFFKPVFKEWLKNPDKGVFIIEYLENQTVRKLTLAASIDSMSIISNKKR